MVQKLLIGVLMVAIVGVVGVGVYEASQAVPNIEALPGPEAAAPAEVIPVEDESVEDEAEAPAVVEPTAVEVAVEAAPVVEATPDPAAQTEANTAVMDGMGDPWTMDGVITVVEDMGFTFSTADGEFFVELGPATYWQAQGVPLAVGDIITVDGFYNGEQVHARIVYTETAQLAVRNEDGMPLWSGGAENGNGTHEDGATPQPEFQVAADDWLTLTGTITRVANGQVTMTTDDGQVLALQMGQPNFWQSQGVTLSIGDPVEVLGFWSGAEFMAGDITKTETGEHIMLRDPNGRQLWAGPGRSGGEGGGGNGSGNQGTGNQYGQSN